jgi:uncharacterized protein (DUF362 family)/NAD-dependent dihydropyrimidine dehydrogenase PreA subunit
VLAGIHGDPAMSKVLVMESTYDACTEAVEQAFSHFPIDMTGKKVAIKTNALKASDPDQQAMATHYKLVKAVVEKVETLRPSRIVVGDSVGTESYGNSEYVFRISRQKEAAGPYYRNLNRRMTVVEMQEPFKRKIALLRDVMEADVYISVPKMKTHGLTMISGAMKNNYGLLAGAQKSWFHYYSGDPARFARVIVELFRFRPPDLVIMDGILAMEGYGPASPETRWVNKILAATDAVALDTVEAKIVGFTVDDIPYLKIARELGLGETNLNAIEVAGKASTIQEYHRPVPPESSYRYKAGVGSGWTNREFFRTRVAYRPVFSSEKCDQECKACVDACPSGALTRRLASPILDPEKCMLCTACRESCEHDAIRLEPDEKILSLLKD